MSIRFALCLSLACLTACASPSPDMMGGTRTAVHQGGMDFVVVYKNSEAQVIRLGALPRKRRAGVPVQMALAAARATGCAVIPYSITTAVPGDPGVARFDLDCGG